MFNEVLVDSKDMVSCFSTAGILNVIIFMSSENCLCGEESRRYPTWHDKAAKRSNWSAMLSAKWRVFLVDFPVRQRELVVKLGVGWL